MVLQTLSGQGEGDFEMDIMHEHKKKREEKHLVSLENINRQGILDLLVRGTVIVRKLCDFPCILLYYQKSIVISFYSSQYFGIIIWLDGLSIIGNAKDLWNPEGM